MTRLVKRMAVATAAVALLLAQAQPAVATVKDRKAKKLLQQGQAQLKKGAYQEALLTLMKAQSMDPSPLIKVEVAAAYRGLGDNVQAAQLYEQLLLDPQLFGKPKQRVGAELEAVRESVGRLTITFRRKDATVVVNGNEVGTTPLALPVYVEPGEVKIEVRIPARTVKVIDTVEAGEHKTVDVPLKQEEKPKRVTDPALELLTGVKPGAGDTGTAADVPPPPDRPPEKQQRARKADDRGEGGFPPRLMGRRWTWVAAGSAAVFGIVGIGVGASALSDYGTYKDDATPSSDYPDLEDGISTKATVANVFFGLAGAAVVATAILYFVEGGSDERPAQAAAPGTRWFSAAPSADGQGGQVVFGTQF